MPQNFPEEHVRSQISAKEESFGTFFPAHADCGSRRMAAKSRISKSRTSVGRVELAMTVNTFGLTTPLSRTSIDPAL